MSAKGVWVAFSVGVAAGALVALLYAPDSGENTRKKLGDAASDAYDQAGNYIGDANHYLQDQADRLAQQSKAAYASGSESVAKAYGAASDAITGAYDTAASKVTDFADNAKDKASQYADSASAATNKAKSMV